MNDKIACIISKILNIVIILASLAFIPFQIYYIGAEPTFLNTILLSFFSTPCFLIGWFGLLKTNSPITRYNPLTLNKKWKNKMEHSMDENPSQLFKFDKPDKDEVRNKKIDDILG